MTEKDFKKIARLLKQAYTELEQELLKEGLTTLSPEFEKAQAVIRETILKKFGFTLEEYRTIKDKLASDRQAKKQAVEDAGNISLTLVEAARAKLEELNKVRILTAKEISEIAKTIAEQVAQTYIKPPQIINQIIKETTVEKPTIVKETKIEQKTERVEYDDKILQESLTSLKKRLDEIKIPKPLDTEAFKEEVISSFSKYFKDNINILGMPDFRKLAMGLQGQIDGIMATVDGKIRRTTHGINIGNGTDVITTGLKGFIEIPFSGTITRWTLLSIDASVTSGSIVIDVWKDTYANYPPTVADTMITSGTKPVISTATKGQDTTVDWTVTTVTAGDIIGFNVDSVTSLKKVILILTLQHD